MFRFVFGSIRLGIFCSPRQHVAGYDATMHIFVTNEIDWGWFADDLDASALHNFSERIKGLRNLIYKAPLLERYE